MNAVGKRSIAAVAMGWAGLFFALTGGLAVVPVILAAAVLGWYLGGKA